MNAGTEANFKIELQVEVEPALQLVRVELKAVQNNSGAFMEVAISEN